MDRWRKMFQLPSPQEIAGQVDPIIDFKQYEPAVREGLDKVNTTGASMFARGYSKDSPEERRRVLAKQMLAELAEGVGKGNPPPPEVIDPSRSPVLEMVRSQGNGELLPVPRQDREVASKPSPQPPVEKGRSRDSYGFGEDGLDALREAQALAAETRGGLGVYEGLSQIGSAFGGQEHDTKYFDRLRSEADRPVEDLKARRNARVEDMKMQDEASSRDPQSARNVAFREQLAAVFPKAKSMQGFDQITLEDAGPFQKFAQLHLTSESNRLKTEMTSELAKTRMDDINQRADKRLLAGYQARAESHPEVKKADERIRAANTVKELVALANTHGGQALAALQAQVPRLMGEVGVLTETDVQRYVRNPQLARGIWQDIQRLAAGTLPDGDAKTLQMVTDVMIKYANDKKAEAYDRVSQQYAQNEGIPFEDARKKINPYASMTPESNVMIDQKEQLDSKIRKALEAGYSQEEIEEYLRAKGQ